MVNKCCVVGCTSGYRSNKEKVIKFSAPKDRVIRQKWQKAIPRSNYVVHDKTYVCVKHFKDNDILRYWESGEIRIPYKRYRLREGAVPSIFPDPTSLSTRNKFRESSVLHLAPVSEISITRSIENENILINSYDTNWEVQSTIILCINENLFYCLNQPELFQCPTPWIPITKFVKKDEFCIAILNEESSFPTVEKCIKVDKQSQVSFWIHGKKMKTDELNIIPGINVTQFKENIRQFESILVCQGGPLANQFSAVFGTLCTISSVGLIRHNDCEIIIKSKSKCCAKCNTLKIKESLHQQAYGQRLEIQTICIN